jgi:hypothetical protein
VSELKEDVSKSKQDVLAVGVVMSWSELVILRTRYGLSLFPSVIHPSFLYPPPKGKRKTCRQEGVRNKRRTLRIPTTHLFCLPSS